MDELASAVSETSEDNADDANPTDISSPAPRMETDELADLYHSLRTPSYTAEDAPGFDLIGESPSALLGHCPLPTDNPPTPAVACPTLWAGTPTAAAQSGASAAASPAIVGSADVGTAASGTVPSAHVSAHPAVVGNPQGAVNFSINRAGPFNRLTAPTAAHTQEVSEQESHAIRSLEAALRDPNPTVRSNAEAALRLLTRPISAAGKRRLTELSEEMQEQGADKQIRTRSLSSSAATVHHRSLSAHAAPVQSEENEEPQVFRSLSFVTAHRCLAAATTPPPAAPEPAEQQVARICACIDALLLRDCPKQPHEVVPASGFRGLSAAA